MILLTNTIATIKLRDFGVYKAQRLQSILRIYCRDYNVWILQSQQCVDTVETLDYTLCRYYREYTYCVETVQSNSFKRLVSILFRDCVDAVWYSTKSLLRRYYNSNCPQRLQNQNCVDTIETDTTWTTSQTYRLRDRQVLTAFI